MPFAFGARSLSFVSHVDTRLLEVARLAIALSTQDFGFTEEQSRTLERERELVAEGKSHTLHSHHLIDADPRWAAPGCSGALDAVPWVAGRGFVWEWPLIYPIALAFQQASHQLSVPITWGGVWDRLMSELSPHLAAEVAAYEARQAAAGNRRVLIDGPHFELGRN